MTGLAAIPLPAPLDAPLTPDGDEARRWVRDELARAEYGTELSPLTRAIRWVLQALADAFGGGGGQVPVGAIVLILVGAILVVLLVVVLINPVRLRAHRSAGAVFDGEDHTLEDCRAAAREASRREQWDEAVIWSFRVLVLSAAAHGLVHDGPGLTAHEAAAQALAHRPDREAQWRWAADLFDAVRYGQAPDGPQGARARGPAAAAIAGRADVERLRLLIEEDDRPLRETPSRPHDGIPQDARRQENPAGRGARR